MRLKPLIAITLAVVFMAGCAAMQPVTARDMTTLALETYNSTFDAHKAQSARPDLSDEEKSRLDNIRETLIRIKPSLIAYAEIVGTGSIPPADIEAAFHAAVAELARIARERQGE